MKTHKRYNTSTNNHNNNRNNNNGTIQCVKNTHRKNINSSDTNETSESNSSNDELSAIGSDKKSGKTKHDVRSERHVWTNKIVYGVPVSLAIGLYLNTLNASFVYDDNRAILGNPDVLGESALSEIWKHDFWGAPLSRKGSHGSWRPLTTLSFRLNAALAGGLSNKFSKIGEPSTSFLNHSLPPAAWSFHAINIILHAAVTAAYIAVLEGFGVAKAVCFAAGGLFAVHPIHVEAVAGLVGRAELLGALAFCLALGAYAKYLRGKPCGRLLVNTENDMYSECTCFDLQLLSPSEVKFSEKRKHKGCIGNGMWLLISGAAAGVGLMCKEQAVTALGVAIVFHTALAISTTPKTQNIMRVVANEIWPCAITTVLVLGGRFTLTSYTPTFTAADNPVAHAPELLTRVLSIARIWATHARLLLWPSTLSFDWSMGAVPLIKSLADPANLETAFFVFVLSSVSINAAFSLWTQRPAFQQVTYLNKFKVFHYLHSSCHDVLNNNNISYTKETKNKSTSKHSELFYHQVTLGLALLVIPFLPASNLPAWVGFVVAERILYLPSMGMSLLVALGAHKLYLRSSKYPQLFQSENYFTFLLNNLFSSEHQTIESTYRTKHRPKSKYIIGILWFLFLGLLGLKTWNRNFDWMSDETLYLSGVSVNPPKALANLGVVYSEQGRIKEAEHAYRSALNHAPNMADTHYNLGLLLTSNGRLKEGVESYKSALNSRPWFAQAHLALAAAYSNLGLTEDARKVLESCTTVGAAPAKDGCSHQWAVTTCRQKLARYHLTEKNIRQSIEEIMKSLEEIPPGYPVHILYTLLAEAHIEVEEHSEATSALSLALAAKHDHVPAHLTFSKMLQANGSRVEEAEQWLRRAVAIAPEDIHAHKHLGQLLLEQGRSEEAVRTWLRAASLGPDDHTAAFNAATALRLAGKLQHAESFYRKAVALLPEDVSSQRNLGAILHLNGKFDEAKIYYEKALVLSPGDPQTTTNLLRLKALVDKKGKQ